MLEVSTMRKGGGEKKKVNIQPKSFLFLIPENIELSKKRCIYLHIWVYRSIYPLT